MDTAWERTHWWKTLYKGIWRQYDHTNINELRVAVGLLRHLGRSSQAWHRRHLIFIDSLVALGAASKGRSSAAPLLRLCRQLVPLSLILGLRPYFRYIRSESNPADGPSRGLRVGAAEETKRAHADRHGSGPTDRRLTGMGADPPAASSSSSLAGMGADPPAANLPALTPASVQQLLQLGRDQKGFAGG